MNHALRTSTGLAAGVSGRNAVAVVAHRQLRRRSFDSATISLTRKMRMTRADFTPSPDALSPVDDRQSMARLMEMCASGPEILKQAEKAAAKAMKKQAKKERRDESSSSSSSSESSESSDSEIDEEAGTEGRAGAIDAGMLAVSLSRLSKRRSSEAKKRREKKEKKKNAAVVASTETSDTSSSSFLTNAAAAADEAASTVLHILSNHGNMALPFMPPPSIDGDGVASDPSSVIAVCIGPDCARRGSVRVANELAKAELLGSGTATSSAAAAAAPPRTVVRCGCLGECGGRKGRLAKGAMTGPVLAVSASASDVGEEVEKEQQRGAATASSTSSFERLSLAPLV